MKTMPTVWMILNLHAVALAGPLTNAAPGGTLPEHVTRVPVVFSGGHDTNPRDGGRPVVLIAAALSVSSDVFRDAFSQVHPADPNVGPTGDEARQNKAALLGALGKYGITNDRLDQVSDSTGTSGPAMNCGAPGRRWRTRW